MISSDCSTFDATHCFPRSLVTNMFADSASPLNRYNFDSDAIGAAMHNLIARLYPICRSITGDGVRQTLRILQELIPLNVYEIDTGRQVFDWTIPNEWNIRDGWVKNAHGEKLIDFQESNLQVVNYSVPIQQRMTLEQLKPHLHTIPEQPDWIPYRTSYYRETWGFCLTQTLLDSLEDGEYEVYIDSSLKPGSLTYGEYVLPGEHDDEILISTHICHPSLCNDNLSGIALTVFLARALSTVRRRYSYRFLFLSGTIGSIAWLSQHEKQLTRIKHGLVAACVGDAGKLHYKRSRHGNAEIDRAVLQALKDSGKDFAIRDFSPIGYDERQYCSPGINLPVGSLSRTPHGQFAEYHSSADNLDFVKPAALADSLHTYLTVCDVLEHNQRYQNLSPMCEPQLGRRGLYGTMGGRKDSKLCELTMLWVLNYSDGQHSLLDIAEKSGIDFATIHAVAEVLLEHKLLALTYRDNT